MLLIVFCIKKQALFINAGVPTALLTNNDKITRKKSGVSSIKGYSNAGVPTVKRPLELKEKELQKKGIIKENALN